MSKIIKIYCEGTADSSDFEIISKIIDGLPISIVPIGGKYGTKSAIQVHERGTSKSDFKLFFRDRDFDRPVPTTEKLTSDGTYVYFSYRTTIENYMIDYELLKKYYKLKELNVELLEGSFYEAAKEIKYFQALRYTLGELRISTDFGTNIVNNSGILPANLSQRYCREKGYEKISKSISLTEGWKRENYDKVYDKYVHVFSDEFIEADEFLIYFQGKDFMKSLSKKLSDFSPKDYYKFVKAQFDYTQFKDLVELRELIETKL